MARKGKYHFLELGNKRFGRLVVKRKLEERLGAEIVWECRCDCGVICKVRRGHLITGTTKSCGCLRKDVTSGRRRLRPYESLYNNCRTTALRRGLCFDFSYVEFVELTAHTECHYCGKEVKWAKVNLGKNGPSSNLDRKDSEQGYTKDNCLICCGDCNLMKSDHSYGNFLKLVRRIQRHTRGK
jgi:hypothetical protein